LAGGNINLFDICGKRIQKSALDVALENAE